MALGGGSFTTQNKVLPGTYINFVSTSNASATLSDRGYATMGLELDWGPENEIFEVTNGDFQKNSLSIFGYEYSHEKLKGLRDLFINCKVLYAYRLNGGTKASNEFGTAKYAGVRGNDISITISRNADDNDYFDVSTLMDTNVVDTQTVASYLELIDNDYVTFDKDYILVEPEEKPENELEDELQENLEDESSENIEEITSYDLEGLDELEENTEEELDPNIDLEFEVTPNEYIENSLYEVLAIPLVGGSSDEVTVNNHQNYLNRAESFSYNILGVITSDDSIKQLYSNFVKRLRDEVGVKFQLVLHDYQANYEGVINVKNVILDDEHDISSLVYYVTGLQASCEVNKSCLNKTYAGEFNVNCDYTQSELVQCIKNGEFVYHNVGYDKKVLNDINSLVSLTDDKNDLFTENQTIRVVDQIANDMASLFNTKYLGSIPNNHSGRVSFWTDIVKLHTNLQNINAIENFSSSDVIVEQGEDKRDVVVNCNIQVVNAMVKVYMIVQIS